MLGGVVRLCACTCAQSRMIESHQRLGWRGPTPVFLRPEIAELRPVRLALRPALLPTRFLPHQPDAFRQTLQHFAHLQPYVCDIVAHAQLFPD